MEEEKTSVHIISHSHWDREWYMEFEKHRFFLINLIDRLIEKHDKGEQFESFHLDGQTVILEDYFEIRPDRKEAVKEMIELGKLHIGPWYVLQDAFLTSAESNVRNLLYGLKDSEAYGHYVKLGYFPDTFGIYGQAPQILQQAGIDTAAFGRGVKPTGFNNMVMESANFESPYSELEWKAPDGSSVLGVLFANWYSNGNEIPVNREEAKVFWDQKLADAKKYASTNQLLFMNGCDHQPLQTDLPEAIQTAEELYPDIDFIHSSFDTYRKELKRHLPSKLQTIHGELRNQKTDGWSTLVNTASSRVHLKQMNQTCQTLLENGAEPMAALAHLTGEQYPEQYLEYAWKTLMKNHPHDSICGCSIDEVHKEMETRYNKAESAASIIINQSAQAVAEKIDTSWFSERAIPIVVYNTSGWNRDIIIRKTVELEKVYFDERPFSEIPDYLESKQTSEWQLYDAGGRAIHADIAEERVEFDYDLPNDRFRKPYFAKKAEVSFLANNLPAFGYQLFYLLPEKGKEQNDASLFLNDRQLENEHVQLTVHDNGSFDLMDKETGKQYSQLGIYQDTGDIGNEYMFKQTSDGKRYSTIHEKAEIQIIKDTPLEAKIEVIHEWELPAEADELLDKERQNLIWHPDRQAGRSSETKMLNIRTSISLEKNAKGPKIKAVIDNSIKDHRLRVLFPTDFIADHHQAASVFEVAERPNVPDEEWENPAFDHHLQQFVSISDNANGLTIATKGLNEYEILEDRNTIAVTMLRSVGEMGDWGVFPTPEAQCLGENTAEWMVIPHKRGVLESHAFQEAYQYLIPCFCEQTTIHPGILPSSIEYLDWNQEGLAISNIKIGRSGDLFIRWFNPGKHPVALKAHVNGCNHFYQSNIVEKKKETRSQTPTINTVVEPYKIVTYAFRKDNENED
ncbi:alpha-mannosidase [Sediminibacillus halophilus]|uniref:Alpha-mannosidase n=1 Tax=Sediminibacillus halophilus TaxID=482461 RepID=A0A1G9U7A9_9BACI|nr:alpha-mannosidase [Sediminibacillus halophilus]SDM55866.1 alpha-mannosidase [Sediminibacillus halophilus]